MNTDNKFINIAIDGPAGAGKSTVAKKLASKLNILYLDTGAMYRAIAYTMLKNNISINNECAVVDALENIKIDVLYVDGKQQTLANGLNVSDLIRTNEISNAASDVSKYSAVRNKMVDLQRKIAQSNDMVLDGRDITSYVLPNADFKFFLTASPEIRAKRRYNELIEKGASITYEKVLKELIERDKNDSTRKIAPLTITEDSMVIDSSFMTIDEVIDLFIKTINNGKKV